MKYHYHVLHEHILGIGTFNEEEVTTTKQKAWNIAQELLRNDREAGRKVRKVGKQKWSSVLPDSLFADYICEIITCYETDCGFLDV